MAERGGIIYRWRSFIRWSRGYPNGRIIFVGLLLMAAGPWVVALGLGQFFKLFFVPAKPNNFAPLVVLVAITVAGVYATLASGVLLIVFALSRLCLMRLRRRVAVKTPGSTAAASPDSD